MKPDVEVAWPGDLARAYRLAGCWRGRPLGSYLWEWAARSGDRIAVIDGDDRLTYRELAGLADELAEGLADLGLGDRDAVLVQLPNQWEFVVVTLACFRLGVVPVMMLPPHREYELTSIGAHVDARALIVPSFWKGCDHEALAHRVADALPGPARVLVVGEKTRRDSIDVHGLLGRGGDLEARRSRLDRRAPSSSEIAICLLSGGTTGVPKVIARTHDDYEYNIRRSADVCGFGPETVYLAVLPAGHNYPLASPGILGTLYSGGRVVLLPSPRPEAVLTTVEAEGVTVTSTVPAVVLRWMEVAASGRWDLKSLRYVHVGGSMLSPEIAARIGPALGCRLQQVYGMAEGLICYTRTDATDEVAYHTQGSPISPYDQLRLVDPQGRAVARGEVGELLTRGPYTPCGYYRAPKQNALSFTPDGWYRTGDLVRLTSAGNVVVCGRVKDLINRAGEKISSAEIETLVQEMPEVAETAAVAMPDSEVGERVCLFARVHQGHELTLAEVNAALSARGLATFKMPERLEVVDDIPHTPIGKPDKKALLKLLLARTTSGSWGER